MVVAPCEFSVFDYTANGAQLYGTVAPILRFQITIATSCRCLHLVMTFHIMCYDTTTSTKINLIVGILIIVKHLHKNHHQIALTNIRAIFIFRDDYMRNMSTQKVHAQDWRHIWPGALFHPSKRNVKSGVGISKHPKKIRKYAKYTTNHTSRPKPSK